MAGAVPDAIDNELLKALFGQASAILGTSASARYLALTTTADTKSTAGTEATGGGYARVRIDGANGFNAAPAGDSISNSVQITVGPFSGAVSASAPIVGVEMFDASSGGNRIAYWTLADQTKTYGNGDTFVIAIGALTFTSA